jgi:hypothetical protein
MSKTPNFALIDEQVKSEKNIEFAYKSLKNEWNYDDEFIMKVAKTLECATAGNIFLDSFDASDRNIIVAWERYCNAMGIDYDVDDNPFIDYD